MIINNFKLKKAGFTLVEILLALLIFTIIIGSLYFSIYVGLKSIERGKVNFEIFQELRITLREIQRDLRGLFYEASTELETLEGDKNSLSIICYKTGGLYKVSYFLEDGGFFRSLEKVLFIQSTDNEGTIKFSDARTYQLSSLIKTIDFEYLDENSFWQADWHLNGQYPKAVRITLTFLDAEGLAYEFQSMVSIPIGRRTLVVKSEE
jgi:prepilin-type N-terminal cleavage/methylation domain-containing protein